MANDYRVYINTLVFTLVSCAALLALLVALMYVPVMATYTGFCVTLAVGLLAVVIGAIVRIALYQRRMRKRAKTLLDNVVTVKTCPDYYTAKHENDGSLNCTNGYVTGDGLAKVTFDSGPATISLSTFDKMTLSQLCDAVDPTDPAKPNYNIPWTALRSTCHMGA